MLSNRLPNLIIAGTVKSGTTSLFSYLSRHPQICSSKIKETCYFLPLRYREDIEHFDTYRQHFRHCSEEKYVLEATPGYFDGGKTVATAIKEQIGDVKIVVVLRDPVDRLISFYNYKKAQLQIDKNLSLEDYLHLCEKMPFSEKRKRINDCYWGIEGGFYSKYLPHWIDVFGNSLRIVFFDDLKNNPVGLLRELCEWLQIIPTTYDTEPLLVENKTVNYKSRFFHQMALAVNTSFEKFFRIHPKLKDFVRRTYYLLNGQGYQMSISKQTLEYLHSLYAPSIHELANQLASHGYSKVPEWVSRNSYISRHINEKIVSST